MAAYAAVVSLMNTMDAVMNDPLLSTCFRKQQIQSLNRKLQVLLHFIENYTYNSLGSDEESRSLERRIASAAHAAEDVIESHVVDQIHAGVLQNSPTLPINLYQNQSSSMHEIDEIKKAVVNVEKKTGRNDQKPKNSPQPLSTGKITMIGFDDYLVQLLDGLTGSESGRQVIPVVGMGGVGKTTLTKNAYENSLTVQHFDVRAWVSISQQYDVKDILVQLLSTLGLSTEGNNELGELSVRLYKYLWGRRYLVVLDDMWSITAWDEIKSFFPKGSDSSRIIVTTRQLEVANALGSSSVVRVGLLDDNKSWDLFCDKAFAQQSCPDELEQIGKAIVKKCQGLPLSIVVIGSLLGNSSQTKEYWKSIAENLSSILSNSAEDNDCLDILCLSYSYLPAHLKPCFLYLGIFGEDHRISVQRLIKLWIAEGFIRHKKDHETTLEEVAEGYVNDLFERSLILVDSLGWNKRFNSFHIHDLVRDLCLREAEKEKFYFVISRHSSKQDIKAARCIVYHRPWWNKLNEYTLTPTDVRSLICQRSLPRLYWPKLLRVCVANNQRLDFDNINNMVNYFQNVNMRLFSCIAHGKSFSALLPQSIFLLWNLQTLIVEDYGLKLEAPVEIWMMRQLRHVEFYRVTLPQPPVSNEEDETVVLHNLQTLVRVQDLRCSDEVCKRIKNIKSLGVYYTNFSKNSNDYSLKNVGLLNKLESLSCNFGEEPHRGHLVQNLTLPASLKELSLWDSNLDWYDLRKIGALPNLQVLKLFHDNVLKVKVWKCIEGEFIALKHLEIRCRDLMIWKAESYHFPVLHTLVLEDLRLLDGIPSGIGDVATLRIVRLRNCDTTTVISAMKMLEEQESQGNEDIQLQLEFAEKYQVEKLLEEVEKEEITCTNYRII